MGREHDVPPEVDRLQGAGNQPAARGLGGVSGSFSQRRLFAFIRGGLLERVGGDQRGLLLLLLVLHVEVHRAAGAAILGGLRLGHALVTAGVLPGTGTARPREEGERGQRQQKFGHLEVLCVVPHLPLTPRNGLGFPCHTTAIEPMAKGLSP